MSTTSPNLVPLPTAAERRLSIKWLTAEPTANRSAVNMKRLKLMHEYHDARIRAIRYRDNADVVIDVELCGGPGLSPSPATLRFHGLRNFAAVQTTLEAARRVNAGRDYIDELVGVLRGDRRGFILDLMTAGDVFVDCRGLHEA